MSLGRTGIDILPIISHPTPTSTSRLLNEFKPLEKVVPTRALRVGSMPCEKRCAEIRNKTVDDENKGDTSGVAYRYLQNRQGQKNSIIEIIMWSVSSGISIYCWFRFISDILNMNQETMPKPNESDYLSSLLSTFRFAGLLTTSVLLPYFILNMFPNTANARRYSETKKHWLGSLSRQVDNACLEEIKKIPGYSLKDLHLLSETLKQRNIDTFTLDEKIEERRQKIERDGFSCHK